MKPTDSSALKALESNPAVARLLAGKAITEDERKKLKKRLRARTLTGMLDSTNDGAHKAVLRHLLRTLHPRYQPPKTYWSDKTSMYSRIDARSFKGNARIVPGGGANGTGRRR